MTSMRPRIQTHCFSLPLTAFQPLTWSCKTSVVEITFLLAGKLISCEQGVPGKGKLLTALSKYWFGKLDGILPNHFVTDDLDDMPAGIKEWGESSGKDLQGRTMLVRKCEVLRCEAIVRGYLTGAQQSFFRYPSFPNMHLSGSAYKEYKQSGTVHGIKLPPGLPESAKLDPPIFTPSTKAAVGDKDENVHPDRCAFTKPPRFY